MKKSLIFIDKNYVQDATDLIEAANQLHGRKNVNIYGFGDREALEELKDVCNVLMYTRDERIHQYDVSNRTNCMEALHRSYDFDSILIPATFVGRMLGPRLAMRLHTGLVADVTAIKSSGSEIELIRPAYSGKLMAGIKMHGKGPLMMTVRPKVFQWNSKDKVKSEFVEVPFKNIQDSRVRLLSSHKKEEVQDIGSSEVLIAGGGGTASYFNKLESLARKLKGEVAASRKIVDQNLASRTIQVGQSGKTVSPKLYIAIGINGAIQHIEGLKNVDHIIAVNKKRSAPICSIADLIVEGNGKDFIEKLLNRLNHKDET